MTFHRKLLTLITLLALSTASNGYGDNSRAVQSSDEIHQLVLNYLKEKSQRNPNETIYEAEYNIRELSESVKLAKCEQPLTLHDRNPDDFLGRMTIGVSCNAPKWQVFIPAEIDGKTKVVVASRAIMKRSAIQAEDVVELLMPYRSAPRGILSNAQHAVGMRTKRAIGVNQPLKIRDLQPPFWVFKNRQVNLVTTIGTVEVITRGEAQENAVRDEQVTVKNLSSGKTLKGVVIAPNTVYIP
ncbi:flagella basal body P-ring formation protein FlgA [Thiosulfatimonas sediminis]|uniref:Flagella basal body P-ring formation protein FlgA n=1 Tax=Thiosulfatimonas sediminis TaxID=2675054 RepID=A0A6F8PTN5_9GAMM|nr:flagellar basal body P-ring formation chaperone FlgA [Thiosulfatimonas sediminis]BBP45502.1 flagella basal body P-ring formation protein FlgA [Thiosulfatimonas sediminis]